MATVSDLASEIASKLTRLREAATEAKGSALWCKLVTVQSPGPRTVQSETKALRVALDRIADLHSEADELLDQLEAAAGLVDENGKRIDE